MLLTCLILASCARPTPSPTSDPFDQVLESGIAHAAAGRRTAAAAAYRHAALLHPHDSAPYLRLAQLYLEWNRPPEGLDAVEAAESRGAPAAEVEALRAALYARLADWEEAIRHGEAAIALDPGNVQARHVVAQGYLALGQTEAAQAQYERLLALAPDDPVARERLGALLMLSAPQEAIAQLQKANTPLAQALIDALSETAESDPAHRLTRVGQVCLTHAEPGLAAPTLERALSLQPAYADAHALLGQALIALNRAEEARSHLEEAVQLAPESPLARSLLGLHYLQMDDAAAARPHLEAAYDLDPQNPAFSLYLARAYANLGNYVAARVWLQEATRLAPEDPIIWRQVTRFYLARGLVGAGEGIEAAQTLVELAPQSAVAHDLLGRALFLAGDAERAQEELMKAVELDPTLAQAHYHLGQTYAYLGRQEDARDALTRAQDLNTDPTLRPRIEVALTRSR